MRSDIATIIAFGLSVCGIARGAPTYSCFDPPDEGQTNPLGEGMEDVVGSECCEALVDESDLEAGRFVVWDPVNCNHGPGETAIAEAPLCRAHDTDGCRFCRQSCVGFEGLCITCDEIFDSIETSSPTPSPSDLGTSFPETPAPSTTDAPSGIFPETTEPLTPAPITPAPVTPAPVTPAPVTPAPVTPAPVTPAPVTPAPVVPEPVVTEAPVTEAPSDCECVNTMSAEETAVLALRNKDMVCDPTCSNGEDEIFGVLNCNYFALGQNCRACSNDCSIREEGGPYLDQDSYLCKPCDTIGV